MSRRPPVTAAWILFPVVTALTTVAGAPLAAQTATATATATATRASQDVAMRLHAAWLREMLDLDVKGAVADYQAIANDRQSRHVRWIAVARLGELHRLGVAVDDLGPVHEAPPAIQQVLARLTPLPPVEPLLAGARGEQPANGDPAHTIDLRPATPAAQEWASRMLGPSASERQRQRMQARSAQVNAARRPNASQAERERDEAFHVVTTELDGKADQAENLRALYFPDWKPPPVRGTPAEALARAQRQLDAWLEESRGRSRQHEPLQRLRDEVNARAATDPGAALELLARLPWVCERLLVEPPADK